MCRLQNIAMRDYKESVTTGQTQTDVQTDAGQSDPYVPLCFAGNTKIVFVIKKTDGKRTAKRALIHYCITHIKLKP